MVARGQDLLLSSFTVKQHCALEAMPVTMTHTEQAPCAQ